MGQYEPRDSRIVTNNPSKTPIEPERTGPNEGRTRGIRAPSQVEPENGFRNDSEKQRWQVDEDSLDRERAEPGH